MLITFKSKHEDGSYSFDLSVNNVELNFLMNFAVQSLLEIGAISAQVGDTTPQEVTLPLDKESPFVAPETKAE